MLRLYALKYINIAIYFILYLLLALIFYHNQSHYPIKYHNYWFQKIIEVIERIINRNKFNCKLCLHNTIRLNFYLIFIIIFLNNNYPKISTV